MYGSLHQEGALHDDSNNTMDEKCHDTQAIVHVMMIFCSYFVNEKFLEIYWPLGSRVASWTITTKFCFFERGW